MLDSGNMLQFHIPSSLKQSKNVEKYHILVKTKYKALTVWETPPTANISKNMQKTIPENGNNNFPAN